MGQIASTTGIRGATGVAPDAGPAREPRSRWRPVILAVTCLLIAGFGSASSGLLLMRLSAQDSALHAQARGTKELRVRAAALHAKITPRPERGSISADATTD